jgi:hypothetical protein
MMMTASLNPSVKQPSVLDWILALGGQFIGWVGAILTLLALKFPELKSLAAPMLAIGPILAAPAMTRSGWSNGQPSWVFTGLCFFTLWSLMAIRGEQPLYLIAPLMLSVSFLLAGLSNIAMDQVPGMKNRVFDMKQAFTPAGFIKMLAFIVGDMALLVKVGIQGTLQVLTWPLQLIQAITARGSEKRSLVPEVFSTKNLWMSRRMGGFYFALCGLAGCAAVWVPGVENQGKILMDVFGSMSAIIMNYSLFFTGLNAIREGNAHWLYRLLLVGPVLATMGSSFRATQPWGFGLDQFGSRLNEMYMCGLPLIDGDKNNTPDEDVQVVGPAPQTVPTSTPDGFTAAAGTPSKTVV